MTASCSPVPPLSPRFEVHPSPSPEPESVIIVRDLTKQYGSKQAVRGIDLNVRRGEVVAVLGPNGAGKTTTVEILEGFRRPTGGHVSVLGCDPARGGSTWRARVGVVLQESGPEPGLTVRECLELYAGYYRTPRDIDETLTLVGLDAARGILAAHLSGGQRRRLDLALALIGDPELIFLDEPTTGFDPAARRIAWDVIRRLRDLGKTIFLTTHYMDEAEYLADRIVVIAHGSVVAEGPPHTIGGRARMTATISFTPPGECGAAGLPAELAALAEVDGDGRLSLRTCEVLHHLQLLVRWAQEGGFGLDDLEVRRPTLEDVYLHLTSEGAS